jgi:hypothetical protein
MSGDVRFWPIADIAFCAANVCSWPKAHITEPIRRIGNLQRHGWIPSNIAI